MKTAMQELIEVLKEKMDSLPNDSRFLKHRSGLRSAIISANSLLEKEKQQIMDSCVNCIKEGVEGEGVLTFNETDENIVRKNISDYYDKTYE